MRYLCLAFLLYSLTAGAEVVTSSGYGKTFDEALQNAKTTCIEQVAGTFIIGESSVDQDVYHSRIAQYNGGLITRYTVLSTRESSGLIEIVINADVDTDKVNSMIVANGADIASDVAEKLEKSRDEHNKSQAIISALDVTSQAYTVQVGKITYRNRGDLTDVSVQLKLMHSPKWFDDVRVMAKTIGREVNTGNSDALWILAAFSAILNPALPLALFSVANRADKQPETHDEYLTCFSRDRDTDVDLCYEIKHPFQNISNSGIIMLNGKVVMAGREMQLNSTPVSVDRALFKKVKAGEHVYFESSCRERIFHNSGIVMFGRGEVSLQYDFTARTDDVKQMTRVEFNAS